MIDDSAERGKTSTRARDWQRHYRQSKERWHYQIIRLDHEDADALRSLAQRTGITTTELIRTFVTWGLEEYERDAKKSPERAR